MPWSLAAAISAAIALVWLQRRRRHVPGATDDDPTDLPEAIPEINQVVSRTPDLTASLDLSEHASAVPAIAPLPAGGTRLIGVGAHAAARAALTAVLAFAQDSNGVCQQLLPGGREQAGVETFESGNVPFPPCQRRLRASQRSPEILILNGTMNWTQSHQN
jgi:hypothetical protein